MLGFLGPNGAGKTTTMRAIFGIVHPDAGRMLWDGAPIGLEERLRFGYMPEERGLYPRMPVGEQVAYFGRLHGMSAPAARAAAAAWLERLGLVERARAKAEEPLPYNEPKSCRSARWNSFLPSWMSWRVKSTFPAEVETVAGIGGAPRVVANRATR